MRTLDYSGQFKRDVKKEQKQTSPKRDMEELTKVMNQLAEDISLSPEKRDHPLVGPWKGYRECHVQPDFLLIYKKDNKISSIRFERCGSHSELVSVHLGVGTSQTGLRGDLLQKSAH